jgi:4-amino-4-deoxy-L-arabinose transferase-like glycosyltransferase
MVDSTQWIEIVGMALWLKTHSSYLAAALFGTVGVLVFCLIQWCTRFGVGLEPDSVVYLQVASNIIAGKGVTFNGDPLTHFPPVYPLLLAFVSLGGSEPLEAARWFHATLFGVTLVTVGLIVYNLTQRSLVASLCAILLILSSSSIVIVYVMAWSESPFLLFALISYAFVIFSLDHPGRLALVIAALVLGTAAATRYVGITLILPAVIALLVLQKKPFTQRLVDSVFLSVLSLLPLSIWLLRNVLLEASAANRTLAYHPIPLEYFWEAIETVLQWLCPFPGPIKARALVGLCIVGLITGWDLFRLKIIIKKSEEISLSLKLQILILLFIFSYICMLFLSISYVDAATHLDFRILSPIYIFGVILFLLFTWDVKNFVRARSLWRAMLLYVLLLICYNAVNAYARISQIHEEGIGYTSEEWRTSEVLEFLRFVPEEIPIYSNGPDVINILLHREAKMIPVEIHSTSRLPNQDFASEMAQMTLDLQRHKGLVVYFDNITWRWYLPDEDELQALAALAVIRRATDGVVYQREDME